MGRRPADLDVEIASAVPHGAGTLVLSWFAPEEAAFYREHGTPSTESIVPFIERARTVPCAPDALRAGLRLRLAVPGPAVPVAVLDQSRAFWSGFLDGGGSNLSGLADRPAASGETVALRLVPPTPRGGERGGGAGSGDPLRGPRFRHRTYGRDPDGRPFAACVCLPLDHRPANGRHYPVVYLLPGLGGDETVRFQDGELVERLDAWSASTGCPVILVGVSTRTAYGSTYLADRRWWRFLAQDLPAAIDAEFPTLPGPAGRVIAGQSTGGFNAMTLAFTAPGTFGSIVASAPDALDLAHWLVAEDGGIRPPWLAWMRLEDAVQGSGQMLSFARNWSPTPDGGCEWPADLATGAVRPAVLERWLAHSPLRRLATPEGEAALRALDGRLYIGAARRDEFALYPPAARFAAALEARGVAHRFVTDEGGHFDAQARLADLVLRALERFRADRAGGEGR